MLAIAGADAAERTRRFSFIVAMAVALYAGYLFVPDIHAHYTTVAMHGHRGVYNSAYVAAAMAILTSAFLSLIGFFLVRGSVERDRVFDVDGIVCASPVRRTTFLFGKFASNLATLCAIAGISLVAAMVMQQIRGEDHHFDALAYVMPFLLVTIPAMATIAAIAIVLDVVKPLRGVWGAILFVFLWTALLSVPVTTSGGDRLSPFDPLGTTAVSSQLRAAAMAAFPNEKTNDMMTVGFERLPKGEATTYRFDGMRWTLGIIAQRSAWLGLALLLVLAASVFFDRFRREAAGSQKRAFAIDWSRVLPKVERLRLVRAEFLLLVNGTSIWWLLGAIGITIALATAPLDAVTRFILPVAFIWPLERTSALGARERIWNVAEVLASTRGFATRTLVTQWFCATLLCSLLCAGYIARLGLNGDPLGILACVAVAAATAAAALAAGTITGTPRFFEAAYLIVWYLGPMNRLPFLDYSQTTITAPGMLSMIAMTLSIAFLASAAIARSRRSQ